MLVTLPGIVTLRQRFAFRESPLSNAFVTLSGIVTPVRDVHSEKA